MRKIVFYFLLILSFIACGGVKKVAIEDMPLWLRERPSAEEYIVGVGSAQKLGPPDSYMKIAREKALSDMAQSVSVNVTSLSTSNILEGNAGLTESYQQNVKSNASEIFEGVELVDQFDDGFTYYTYYRINKAEFFRLKAERKQKALTLGLNYFLKAKQETEARHIVSALSLYVKVINSIVYYLKEDTKINYESKDIDLAYQARNNFDKLVTSLTINTTRDLLEVKRGCLLSSDDLRFIVEFNAEPIAELPVIFAYSGAYLKENASFSDANGVVYASVPKIDSRKENEQLLAKIDIQDIVRKSSNDLFIRNLFSINSNKSVKVNIKVLSPSVLLDSEKKDSAYLDRLASALTNNSINVSSGNDYALSLAVDEKEERVAYAYKFSFFVKLSIKETENQANAKLFNYVFSAEDIDAAKAKSKALAKINMALDRIIPSEITRFIIE